MDVDKTDRIENAQLLLSLGMTAPGMTVTQWERLCCMALHELQELFANIANQEQEG
jgi:hypothetical protein